MRVICRDIISPSFPRVNAEGEQNMPPSPFSTQEGPSERLVPGVAERDLEALEAAPGTCLELG